MPVLYVVLYEHEYGADAWVFWYVPTPELPYPDVDKAIKRFNIDFEPEKGESIRLISTNSVDGSFDTIYTAEEIGTATMNFAHYPE